MSDDKEKAEMEQLAALIAERVRRVPPSVLQAVGKPQLLGKKTLPRR